MPLTSIPAGVVVGLAMGVLWMAAFRLRRAWGAARARAGWAVLIAATAVTAVAPQVLLDGDGALLACAAGVALVVAADLLARGATGARAGDRRD